VIPARSADRHRLCLLSSSALPLIRVCPVPICGISPAARSRSPPCQLLALAYRELDRAATGRPEQIRALGDARLLPRPWEPATCRTPPLREQLWLWLEAVVAWLVTEYVWEATDTILACWPQHQHLVHEIAVLADQRRRAGHAFTSDALEEWHRDSLPAFTERMKTRLKNHCEDGHQAWPAKGRHTGYTVATASAAVLMSCSTSSGWETMATWLVETSTVVAPMRGANYPVQRLLDREHDLGLDRVDVGREVVDEVVLGDSGEAVLVDVEVRQARDLAVPGPAGRRSIHPHPARTRRCKPDQRCWACRCRALCRLHVLGGLADVRDVPFERELRRVDTDHDKALIAVLLGPRPDIAKRAS
jgi:hypothetical protein